MIFDIRMLNHTTFDTAMLSHLTTCNIRLSRFRDTRHLTFECWDRRHTTFECLNNNSLTVWVAAWKKKKKKKIHSHMCKYRFLLRLQTTVEPQQLWHRWLLYHGKFEHASKSLRNPSDSSRKQIFKEIFLFYHEILCCVYSLESPHRGDSNEYTHLTIIV